MEESECKWMDKRQSQQIVGSVRSWRWIIFVAKDIETLLHSLYIVQEETSTSLDKDCTHSDSNRNNYSQRLCEQYTHKKNTKHTARQTHNNLAETTDVFVLILKRQPVIESVP